MTTEPPTLSNENDDAPSDATSTPSDEKKPPQSEGTRAKPSSRKKSASAPQKTSGSSPDSGARSGSEVGDPSRKAAQAALLTIKRWAQDQAGLNDEQVRNYALMTMIWLCGNFGIPLSLKEDDFGTDVD